MKKKYTKTWIFYGSLLTLFVVFTYLLYHKAEKFNTDAITNLTFEEQSMSPFQMFFASLEFNILEPVALLLLQIIAILLVSRFFGIIFAKMGQPTVIGEILAGIVLGPSLFGYLFPDAFNFLFAAESLGNLYILSQVGLVLFMFIIGLELDLKSLKDKLSETYVISHASIIIPFFLGSVLSYFIYEEFAAGHTTFLSFSLFMGISMSITAFPVLARIVQEKGLTKTHLGTIAIASAANDDVTAWCLLAAVIAIAKTGSFVSSLFTIGVAIIYVLAMLLVVRPFLKRVGGIYSTMETMNKSIFAFYILILITSAYITQFIGIHALFGAFLAGVIMPPFPNLRKMMIERVEDVSVTLFLPLFFVYTGLNTKIGLLNTPYLWGMCGIVILVAVAGKFMGSALAAKIAGESTKDSLSIGILMNTRGLMELIVLNIGYEMGILPPTVFVMLVIMAIVTTFMTTPALSLIEKIYSRKEVEEDYRQTQAQGVFKALISMGDPVKGEAMLRVAKSVLDGVKKSLDVTVLHITPGADTNPIHSEQFAEESFAGIKEEAKELNIPIHICHRVTDSIEGEIVRMTNYHRYDFLLVGANISASENERRYFVGNIRWLNRLIYRLQRRALFYPGSLIKDKTRYFIENSQCSVGVFVNRNFKSITDTVLLLNDESDVFLLRYARYLLKNSSNISITVMDTNKVLNNNEHAKKYDDLKKKYPHRINKNTHLSAGILSTYSFMLIAYRTWENLSETGSEILLGTPSTLIINKKSLKNKENDLDDNDNEEFTVVKS